MIRIIVILIIAAIFAFYLFRSVHKFDSEYEYQFKKAKYVLKELANAFSTRPDIAESDRNELTRLYKEVWEICDLTQDKKDRINLLAKKYGYCRLINEERLVW